jgi:outer membrane beta-barrel protein
MKRRFVKVILAAVAAAGLLSVPEAAQAQEIELTGPLKGAPAVRHQRLYRQGRFELAPAISFTLLDQYRRTILAGARLNFNITDWLAIGVWGSYGVLSTTTDLTDRIDAVAPRDALTAVNVNHGGSYPNYSPRSFADQTAQLTYVVAPQLTFIPFRGKLAIFNKIFVDTDFYVAGGVGLVGVKERKACGDTTQPGQVPCSDPSSFTPLDSTMKISPTFGVGLTFYPGDWFSLGVEYRALPFWWNLAGFDSRGSGPNGNFPDTKINGQDDTFHFNQLVTITLGFSFPVKPRISD